MHLKAIDKAMKNEGLTSEALVNEALEKIKHYDDKYKAVIDLNPNAIFDARRRDEERRKSGRRSLMDGVPIMVKDNIDVAGLPNTAGSLALLENVPYQDATLIKQLKKAGAIILGKTNLSEFAYFMHQKNMPSGYSSRGGQVINPFGKDLDPLGSSTGSAVAVALGYTILTIGTETSGSLMAPAAHTSTVAIKPTVGVVSRHGIIPISHVQDTAGPMGRTVEDCAIALEAMKGLDVEDEATLSVPSWSLNYETAIHGPIKDLKVGFLTLSKEDALKKSTKKTVFHLMKEAGVKIEDVSFTPVSLNEILTCLKYEFKSSLNAYLKDSALENKQRDLKSIIRFNNKHKDVCLRYGQDLLNASEKLPDNLNHAPYIKARKAVNDALKAYKELYQTYDILLTFDWNHYGPALGHPSIAVPTKDLHDQIPLSLIVMGPSYSEERLIALAHYYEKQTLAFKPPKL